MKKKITKKGKRQRSYSNPADMLRHLSIHFILFMYLDVSYMKGNEKRMTCLNLCMSLGSFGRL